MDSPLTTSASSTGPGEDDRHDQLRPKQLADFVGADDQAERLETAIYSARARNVPCDHILLHGPPGTGKTTLASIVADSLGARFLAISGPSLSRAIDVVGVLVSVKAGDVLFIDEIHRLPKRSEEFLYTAMEDFYLDAVQGKGINAMAVRLELEPFCLIGATTLKGRLSAPLRDRFGLDIGLELYPVDQLADIVCRSAELLEVPIAAGADTVIARRSRGTPRIANRLLRRVRDFTLRQGGGVQPTVTPRDATLAIDLEGIDSGGLDPLDRRYLHVLTTYYGGTAGVSALAATLQTDVLTLTAAVEPFLLYDGYILRTSQGRVATDKARRHLIADATSRIA